MGYNMLSSNIFLTWLEPASLWGYFCNEFFVLNLTAVVFRGAGGHFVLLLFIVKCSPMPACHCPSCLKKKKERKKDASIVWVLSHHLWLSKTSLFWFLQPYLSVALDCLTGQINSLPYVNKCRFFFFFPLCYRESKCSTFLSFSFSLSLTVLGAGPSLLQQWYLLISLHVWEMTSSGRLASTLWAIIKLRFVAQSILGVSVLWPNFLIASA